MFFLNLANSLKIKIILLLKEKELNVSNISKKLNVEQSKISHALKSLKECKLVLFKKSGKERIYYLNKKTIIPILNIIENHVLSYCKEKCLKLDNQPKLTIN